MKKVFPEISSLGIKHDDFDRFISENNGYELSKDTILWNGNTTKINKESFRKLSQNYAIDSTYIYYRGNKLTVKTYPSRSCKNI